jgi:N6-adenosine-specific RNA methylase IME4
MKTTQVPETTVTKNRFHPGDKVIEDLNKPEWGESSEALIRRGTVLEYTIMPGTTNIEPLVQWEDRTQGFVRECDLKPYAGELKMKPLASTEIEAAIAPVTPEPEPDPDLKARLEAEEHVITVSRNKLMLSLRIIKDDELWRATDAESFVAYCEQRWNIKKSQAYALATGGETISNLLDSGVPESDIPTAVSVVEAIAQAPAHEQASVLQQTQQRDGSVTAAGVKRSLKGRPSLALVKALWAQVGIVETPATPDNPEHFTVSGVLFDTPREFLVKEEAQLAWEMEGQKLCASAWQKFSASRELRETFCNVPVTVVSSTRNAHIGARAYIMGSFDESRVDARGNSPTPWDYSILINGNPVIGSIHLFQVKIDWEDTALWQPTRFQEPTPAKQPTSADYSSQTPTIPAMPVTKTVTYATDDERGQQKQAIAANLPQLTAFPTGNYPLIVVDPPWHYDLRETDASHRGRTPYPTMNDEQILSLPMGDLAAEDGYILLWATNSHLPLAFDCLACWGYDYKAIHTWVKRSPESGSLQIGLGHYGRNCTEHFLVGVRGKPGAWSSLGLTSQPTAIFEGKREHSRKPEQFWELAQALKGKLGGSAIELFARDRREGWDFWGLEA